MIDTKLVQQLLETARSVTPLTALRAASLDPRQQAPEDAPMVRARVAARLPDGTFRVVVEGKSHRLALPPEVKPGDLVELRIVPRASEIASSPGPITETTETLSRGAQVLARVLAQPRGEPPRQSEPVVTVPPSGPEDLSEPLARAVERSGVFYESHQARWIDGDYPLQRLLEEPQAKLSERNTQHPETKLAPRAPATSDPARSTEKPVVALPVQRLNAAAPGVELAEHLATSSSSVAAADPERADAVTNGVPKDALPLVRQQLDTLEMRQLTWAGDIWPGQALRWEIAEEPEHEPGTDEPSQQWRSRLELCLPLLGTIGADIQLNGAQLRIRLTAQDRASAAEMRTAAEDLTQALRASGLQIAACAIECHEPAR